MTKLIDKITRQIFDKQVSKAISKYVFRYHYSKLDILDNADSITSNIIAKYYQTHHDNEPLHTMDVIDLMQEVISRITRADIY